MKLLAYIPYFQNEMSEQQRVYIRILAFPPFYQSVQNFRFQRYDFIALYIGQD